MPGFRYGGLNTVARQRSQANEALSIIAAEIAKLFVINTIALRCNLTIRHLGTCSKQTVQDLGLDSVSVLIPDAQLRCGRAQYSLAAISKQAGLCHSIETIVSARYVCDFPRGADGSLAAEAIGMANNKA